MSTLFSKIRPTCAAISERARWVKIDEQRLMQYPETLMLNANRMSHSEDHHLLGKGDDTLTFFLLLDTVNFGSGYFPYLTGDNHISSYFDIAKRLKNFCLKEGLPSAVALSQIGVEECARIFQQHTANPHAKELMQLFSEALNQLGTWVLQRYDGDYLGVLRQSHSVADVVTSLSEMPYFRDVSSYGSTEVPFLKRAQIVLHDMQIAEPNHSLLDFDDYERLTVFADNIIPFVLRSDNILQYDNWLEQRIAGGEIIGAGSSEEIEMRACSIHATEILRTIVSEELRKISAREIDYLLWARGQSLKTFVTTKPHRCRSPFY